MQAGSPAAPGGGGAAAPSRRNVVRMQRGGVVGVAPVSALTVVGEAGPELLNLPAGTTVTPAPATQELTTAVTLLTRELKKSNTRSDDATGTPVVLKIGNREFGRAVVSSINRNGPTFLTSS